MSMGECYVICQARATAVYVSSVTLLLVLVWALISFNEIDGKSFVNYYIGRL